MRPALACASANIRVKLSSLAPEMDSLNCRCIQLKAKRHVLKNKEGESNMEGGLEAVERDHCQPLTKLLKEKVAVLNRSRKQFWREKVAVLVNRSTSQDRKHRKQNVEISQTSEVVTTVGPEQVAEVVSRRTGIPVTQLGQADHEKEQPPSVELDHEVVSQQTGIQVAQLGHTEKGRPPSLEERIRQLVVGQDEAVQAVAKTVLCSRDGLARKDPHRPINSFLFVGPTGVGKVELAKALAKCLFGDEKHLVHLRMSPDPPGYAGSDQEGRLIEHIKQRPHSVVLFEHIEKAHSCIFDTLLRLFKNGQFTDGQGRTADFTNTTIILTSKIGATHLGDGVEGMQYMEISKDRVEKEVRDYFLPELLNNLDEIIVFDPLPPKHLLEILNIEFENVARRLANRPATRGTTLDVTDAARNLVLKKSYDPNRARGAHDIGGWVEEEIVTHLAIMVIKEELSRNSKVVIDVSTDDRRELSYKVICPPPSRTTDSALLPLEGFDDQLHPRTGLAEMCGKRRNTWSSDNSFAPRPITTQASAALARC